MLPKIITTSDTVALAATNVAGAAMDVPVDASMKIQIILFLATKVLAAIPSIVRAFNARRTARKAAVKDAA